MILVVVILAVGSSTTVALTNREHTMNNQLPLLIYCISVLIFLTYATHNNDNSNKLTKPDQQALAIGKAVLKLNELGSAGAPLMTTAQKLEFEQNVIFLSNTESGRMTWAWLEFRLKADSRLKLEENSGAEAIKQRLNLFQKLIRKYFVLE